MKQTKYSLNLTHPHYEHKKRKRKQNKKLYLYTPFQWQVANVIGIKANCGVLHIRKTKNQKHTHKTLTIAIAAKHLFSKTSAVACNKHAHRKFTDIHHAQLAAQTSYTYINTY